MSPTLIQRIWNVVNQSATEPLLSLNDTDLAQYLAEHLRSIYSLNHEELLLAKQYIGQNACLIRDYSMQG